MKSLQTVEANLFYFLRTEFRESVVTAFALKLLRVDCDGKLTICFSRKIPLPELYQLCVCKVCTIQHF